MVLAMNHTAILIVYHPDDEDDGEHHAKKIAILPKRHKLWLEELLNT